MVRTIKAGLVFAGLAGMFLLQPSLLAQDSMKQDDMKHDKMQDDKMMHDGKAKTLETGKFHGKVHATSGRATVYQEADGKLVLRLTNFKTSNGPDVHVILVATKDAGDDANFLKNNTERVELGKLKGNEGDQNYEIPDGFGLLRAVQRELWRSAAGKVLRISKGRKIGQVGLPDFFLRRK